MASPLRSSERRRVVARGTFQDRIRAAGRQAVQRGRDTLDVIQHTQQTMADAMENVTTWEEARRLATRWPEVFAGRVADYTVAARKDVANEAARLVTEALQSVGMRTPPDYQAIAAKVADAGLSARQIELRTLGMWRPTEGGGFRFDPFAANREALGLLRAGRDMDLSPSRVAGDIGQLFIGEDINYGDYGLDRTGLTALRTLGYRGERLATTETMQAANGALTETLREGRVTRATWTLSPLHPAFDECDGLAGKMFDLADWPDTHPNCMCTPGPPFEYEAGGEPEPQPSAPSVRLVEPEPSERVIVSRAPGWEAQTVLGEEFERPATEQDPFERLHAFEEATRTTPYGYDEESPGYLVEDVWGKQRGVVNQDNVSDFKDEALDDDFIEIDPHQTVPTQDYVFDKVVEKYMREIQDESYDPYGYRPPWAIHELGTDDYYLGDGHHRAAAHLLLGQPVRIHVYHVAEGTLTNY